MEDFTKKYRYHFTDKRYLVSLFIGLVILTGGIFANYFASQYATEKASSSVTDIVLSNFPPLDVGPAFVYGPLVFWAIIFFICLFNPKRFPFVIKGAAVFILIRSFFMVLTHIGPFPTQDALDLGNVLQRFVAGPGGDLFFSSHTGLPFLMALIFWHEKVIRYLALLASVSFGTIVLLGHYHYSIDVLSAFFITFSIFHIVKFLFPKDYKIFLSTEVEPIPANLIPVK